MVAVVVSSIGLSIMLTPTHYNLKINTHTQPAINNARTHSMLDKLVFKVIIMSNHNQLRISKQLLRNNQYPFMSMPEAITFNTTVVVY